jgi:hypothetical protein
VPEVVVVEQLDLHFVVPLGLVLVSACLDRFEFGLFLVTVGLILAYLLSANGSIPTVTL